MKSVKRYVKKGIKNTYRYAKKDPVGTARKALSMAKYLHGIINAELKSVNTTAVSLPLDWNGVVIHLSNIVQGDLHNQRNGMSVLARWIQLQMTIGMPAAGLDNANIKYYLLCDTRKNNTSLNIAPSDVFEITGSRAGHLSYLPVNERDRYKIYKSGRISLSLNGKQTITIKLNIDVKKHIKWEFNSTDRLENHLYLVMISDSDPTGAKPLYDYVSKLKYYDN